MITLRIQQMTIDGHPYLCPECASQAFTLDGSGFIDSLPARGNCWQSHSWEDPLITIGGLREIQAASTGRRRAEDRDTFEVVIGGALLAGVLHPEVTLADVKTAGRIYWRRLVKPQLRKHKRRALRAVTRPVKQAARNTVAAAQASALEAAWTAQAGGYEPDPDHQPEPSCPFCDGGYIDIESHIHDTTRVRCSVCHGTGELD